MSTILGFLNWTSYAAHFYYALYHSYCKEVSVWVDALHNNYNDQRKRSNDKLICYECTD